MLTDKHVLVVDDDDDLRNELVDFLRGYLVKTYDASSAKDAKIIMQKKNVDLLVCDIIMPGESGLELTKWVIENKNIPVLLLSSLDHIADRVTGLEIGADDYITKPFDPRELLARLKSILRRSYRKPESTNAEASYTLCSNNELINRSGVAQKLRPSDARLLRLLVQHKGTAVNRDELYSQTLNKAWNPNDRSIDNMIARLRSILEEDHADPKIILTSRNTGYSIKAGTVLVLKNDSNETVNNKVRKT